MSIENLVWWEMLVILSLLLVALAAAGQLVANAVSARRQDRLGT